MFCGNPWVARLYYNTLSAYKRARDECARARAMAVHDVIVIFIALCFADLAKSM